MSGTRRRWCSRLGLALLAAGLLLAGPAPAAAIGSTGTAPPAAPGPTPVGPRPPDPNRECVVGGEDIVEVPAPQRRLDAEGAWELSRGEGVTVAILDSGVDPTHPQLRGQVGIGVDVAVPGFTGNADCVGHGTAMAGLVAGLPLEGIGLHGIAPAARILPVRVLADDLETTPSVLAAGIRAALRAGAGIVLVTVSTPFESAPLEAAVDAAEAANVLVVAPAELAAPEAPTYAFPGAYPTVLAVGAVDGAEAAMDRALDAEPVVDLVAPATGVVAPLPRRGHTGELAGAAPAAAYVAGVAALVRSAYPDLTVEQLRRRLELTADHPGTQAPDPLLGWGVVNPRLALSVVIPAEAGESPPTQPAAVVEPPSPPALPDRTAADRALWIFGTAAILAVALLIAVMVIPRGRRLGWRPHRGPSRLLRRET